MLSVVEHAACSDTGRRRAGNQDAVLARPPLFAVADGVGGARGGDVASKLAVEALGEEEGGGVDLISGVLEAHRRIRNEAAREPEEHGGMATTLTAARAGDGTVALVHVGDSRAYRLRDGRLERLTADHSLAQELRRAGGLDPDQAERHPQRSVITRALGQPEELEVDATEHDAAPGDLLLLCSDGLTDVLGEDDVRTIIGDADSLRAAARELVDAANRAGGPDNVSVVLFRMA
jgi:PPM family protein phosphatase